MSTDYVRIIGHAMTTRPVSRDTLTQGTAKADIVYDIHRVKRVATLLPMLVEHEQPQVGYWDTFQFDGPKMLVAGWVERSAAERFANRDLIGLSAGCRDLVLKYVGTFESILLSGVQLCGPLEVAVSALLEEVSLTVRPSNPECFGRVSWNTVGRLVQRQPAPAVRQAAAQPAPCRPAPQSPANDTFSPDLCSPWLTRVKQEEPARQSARRGQVRFPAFPMFVC